MSHADDGKLNALLDGELGPEEAASVEAHIAGCPDCARRLAEARRFLTESADLLAALDLPKSAVAGRAPELHGSATAKEVGLDRGGAMQSPAVRPEPAGAPRPAFARPPARARLDFTTLAWAATVVLAIGVGYLANEVRHGRAGGAYREGVAARTGEAQPSRTPVSQAQTPAAPARALATAPPPRAASGAGSAPASRGATRQPSAGRPLPAAAALSRKENPVRRGKQLAGGAPADALRQGAPAGRAAKTLALRDSAAAVGGVAAPAAVAEAAQAPANRAAFQAGRAAPAALAEQRLTAFRPAGLEEAVARLGGSIRLIDGMRIDSVEVGPGYRVSGAARDRDLVRIIFLDEQGRRVMLDQQRLSALSDTAAAGARERSDVGMVYGDTLTTAAPNAPARVRWIDRQLFWLSLTASLPADTVRTLVGRVR